MAELTFKAFLSCSLDSKDKEVVEFFRRLIKSFGIEAKVYDYQEIGRVSDKVKEHILNSDCLIAVVTREKKLEGSDLWTSPEWVLHEIAMANAFKKPIAIFYEEGVKIEGLIALEERREMFSRTNFLETIDKTTAFLFNLRSYLESIYRTEKLRIPVLIRHYMHVEYEILSEDKVVERCEILMECLAEELEATHHWTELEDMTPGLSIRPQEFDFVCKEKPDGMDVKAIVIQDSDQKYFWKIEFNPPLKKGEKVKYAYKTVRPNTSPFTYEDLMTRIKNETYEYKEPICEACEWMMSYPTAEFVYKIRFPENYEISKYYVDVRLGDVELKAKNEVHRINEGKMFTAEKIIDRWEMSFKIPKPLQDHTYYIYYVPPESH